MTTRKPVSESSTRSTLSENKFSTTSPAAIELRAYLEDVMPGYRNRWPEAESFDARRAFHRVLNDGGWAALSWPPEFGGRGLDPVSRALCDLELANFDTPVMAGTLGISNVAPTIIAWGTPVQQALLPHILDATHIWCQGFSEPDAGSDLAALRTMATPRGDGFVINGQKVWTSNGTEATHCMLLARTDPSAKRHAGISVLLVPMDLPGIERRPLRMITGESEFAEVFFTDVEVPSSALLGPLDDGWRVTMTTLGYERAGVVSAAARLEREILRGVGDARHKATEPHLRDLLCSRYIDARIVGLLGQRALAALDSDAPPGPAQSVIKLAWSKATQHLSETVLELEGPEGMLGGRPAGQRFLRGRSATIAAGTTEIMRNILAERVLGLPKS